MEQPITSSIEYAVAEDLSQIQLTTVDTAGISLSVACLIHCLLLPLLVPFLPLLAVFENEFVHISLAVILFAIGAWAFIRGYRLHKQISVVVSGVAGISLLLLAIVLHEIPIELSSGLELGTVVTCLGSALLIGAHFFNIRHCQCALGKPECGCEHP